MELLTINKTDAKADEDRGPNIESEAREERIEARRVRIKKKNELNQKKLLGITTPVESDKKKEVSKGRTQIQDSRSRLLKLERDGLELVTNVRVAGDAREHHRRSEEEEAARQRKERLDQEAKSAAEKFEEIIKKWESAQTKDIPQELHEMLMDQKQLCDSMIDEKNKLINDFEMDLKQKDDLYVKTLKKSAEDIDLLIERNKEQIRNMRKFYFEELNNVENAFISERKDILEKFRKAWEDKMEERRHKEITFLEARFKRVEENEKQLHSMRVKDAEEYNEMKVKLETDVQILEQQLQQMKATYQLNQEKLEYNYRVLQKRDEENAKTKAQQKRKITKLQDGLTNFKNKLAKQIKQANDENQQLSDDYKRITDMFTDLQHKSKHFLNVDLKKFHDIWIMNEEKCKEYASQLLNADRIIHEQQLGLRWMPPEIQFIENIGPINSQSKIKTGKEFANELLLTEDHEEEEYGEDDYDFGETADGETVATTDRQGDSIHASSHTPKSHKGIAAHLKHESHNIILNLSKNTLRNILMLVCDEGEFLVEQKLLSLLEPLDKNDQSMIMVDSIFKALNVETEDDVKLLAQYFINHRQYMELIKRKSFILADKRSFKESGVGPNTAAEATATHDDDGNLVSSMNKMHIDIAGEIQQPQQQQVEGETVNDGEEDDGQTEKVIPTDKINLIHPNEVLKALKTFVTIHHKTKNKQKISKFRLTDLDDRDTSGDRDYWLKYVNLIDGPREKVWDAVLFALQRYHGVLNRRSQLIDENDALGLQNKELRILLAQYMQSPVNQELEIPPTKILQMEYS